MSIMCVCFLFIQVELCVCEVKGYMEDGMERFRRLAYDLETSNMIEIQPSHSDSHFLEFLRG